MTTARTDPTTNIDTHAPAVELTPAAREMLDFLSGWMHDCVRRQWEKKAREEETDTRTHKKAAARPRKSAAAR